MVVVRVADTKAPSENTSVIIQADQFPIKAVKLFQGSGGAEITRTFPLSFLRTQDGPQVVEIFHLPANIQSVDVSIASTSGNVTLLDHYRTYITQPKNLVPSSQALSELRAEQKRLDDERRLREQSFTFLTTYMDSLAQCKSQGQPEAAQMVTFFDEFVEIGVTRSAAMAELDSKLVDIDNKILEEERRLSKLNNNLPIKVVAVLSCNGLEAAELTVTYVVMHVSWRPTYDLHISMTGNVPSPTVTLNFRCAVMQWTGENWENISLALTTADLVSQLIRLPEPKMINVGLAPTNASQHMYKGPISELLPNSVAPLGQYEPGNIPLFGQSIGSVFSRQKPADTWRTWDDQPRLQPRSLRRRVSWDSEAEERGPFARSGAPLAPGEGLALDRMYMDDAPPLSPVSTIGDAPVANVPSQAVSRLVSHDSKDPITHVTTRNIFIPSDNAEHHVLVTSLSLQADFMRVVTPSIDTRVYYTCEVRNTSEYILLPGTVKTYLNDKHVSSTKIHSTDLPQMLECALAVDTGVKAIHNRAPDALPSVSAFTGKATTAYTSATVLHNTHAEPVRSVVVRSAIPLPADPRITIVLKEPAGLAEIDEGRSVPVKEGCLARWSTTGGRKGKHAGLFEWVCDMNPGTEVLKAVWEVCAPRDLQLLEQVRS